MCFVVIIMKVVTLLTKTMSDSKLFCLCEWSRIIRIAIVDWMLLEPKCCPAFTQISCAPSIAFIVLRKSIAFLRHRYIIETYICEPHFVLSLNNTSHKERSKSFASSGTDHPCVRKVFIRLLLGIYTLQWNKVHGTLLWLYTGWYLVSILKYSHA